MSKYVENTYQNQTIHSYDWNEQKCLRKSYFQVGDGGRPFAHKLSTKQSQGHKNTTCAWPSCPNLRRLRMAASRQPESLARPLVVEDPLYSPPGGQRHGRNLRDSARVRQ